MSDSATDFARIASSCGGSLSLPLPPHGEEQTFAEPWQAQVFAITVQLNEDGHFSWPEWVAAFAERIRRSDETGADYYLCWADALADILDAKELIPRTELLELTSAWHAAATRTPHGTPIALDA